MKKIIFTLASFFIMSLAHATWPTKPVTIVIPFPPGGPADSIVRNLQPDLEKELGVPVIVLNMSGANAGVAAAHILTRKNDNHIFLFSELEFVIGQVYSKTHMYKEFTPVSTILTTPFILYSNSSSPNLQERFRAQIKNKSVVNLGYVGASVAWLDQLSSPLVMNMVPYRGGAPLYKDVLGGHVEYGISGAGGTWHKIYIDKTFKPVMISFAKRHSSFPDVPTAIELGFGGPAVDEWFTFWAQKNIDMSIQKEFSRIMHKTVAKNKYIQQISKTGYTVVNYNYEETQQYMNAEIAHYEKLPVKQNK
jgi:tripartite-type tricarboxylate transporter receptor subunit TctC